MADDNDEEARRILAECEAVAWIAVTEAGKKWADDALKKVSERFYASIKRHLGKGGKWPDARPQVLKVSWAMGQIAVILSDNQKTIPAEVADAAFDAARWHRGCRVGAEFSPLGGWCEGI